jgi:hypothetical protein
LAPITGIRYRIDPSLETIVAEDQVLDDSVARDVRGLASSGMSAATAYSTGHGNILQTNVKCSGNFASFGADAFCFDQRVRKTELTAERDLDNRVRSQCWFALRAKPFRVSHASDRRVRVSIDIERDALERTLVIVLHVLRRNVILLVDLD